MHQMDTLVIAFFALTDEPTPAAPAVKIAGQPGAQPAAAGTLQPQPASNGGGSTAQSTSTGAGGFLPFALLLAFGVMMVSMLLTNRKEQKKRTEMLSAIRKGDKVQTQSGIVGVITELGQDDVVLRVEEGKIRVVRSAISGVVRASAAPADAKPANA